MLKAGEVGGKFFKDVETDGEPVEIIVEGSVESETEDRVVTGKESLFETTIDVEVSSLLG